MRDAIVMWRSPRLVVLTAVSAAMFVAAMLPFKWLVIFPGLAEVRPAAALPIVFSFLFGPAGAWGAALGNLIGDMIGGMLGPGSIFGFVGNFLYGYLPYKLWQTLFRDRSVVAEIQAWRELGGRELWPRRALAAGLAATLLAAAVYYLDRDAYAGDAMLYSVVAFYAALLGLVLFAPPRWLVPGIGTLCLIALGAAAICDLVSFGFVLISSWMLLHVMAAFILITPIFTPARLVLVIVVASAACASIIGWGIELLGFVPFRLLGTWILINNTAVSMVLVPILLPLLYPRVERRYMLWRDLLEGLSAPAPARTGTWSWVALLAALVGLVVLFGAGFEVDPGRFPEVLGLGQNGSKGLILAPLALLLGVGSWRL